jgi:hypothetical protein
MALSAANAATSACTTMSALRTCVGGFCDMIRTGDRLVPRPDSLVVGDELAVEDRSDPGQVGNDLDPAVDHPGADRVAACIQADAVTT